jgi:hypothetical protein
MRLSEVTASLSGDPQKVRRVTWLGQCATGIDRREIDAMRAMPMKSRRKGHSLGYIAESSSRHGHLPNSQARMGLVHLSPSRKLETEGGPLPRD